MIHVLAFVTTEPGMRAAVLEAFAANVATVHAEEGCVEYRAAIDAPDVGPIQSELGPDSFVVIEKWESLEALAAHGASDHMAAYGASVQDMLVSRVIHVLTPV